MALFCLMTWPCSKFIPFGTLRGGGEVGGELSSLDMMKGIGKGDSEGWAMCGAQFFVASLCVRLRFSYSLGLQKNQDDKYTQEMWNNVKQPT